MRLIDADALLKAIIQMSLDGNVFDRIHEAPTIEPERKTGKWIGTEYDGYADGNPVYYEWKCSACGCVIKDDEPTWNFCPNCGAKMEVERENRE